MQPNITDKNRATVYAKTDHFCSNEGLLLRVRHIENKLPRPQATSFPGAVASGKTGSAGLDG